MIKKTYNILIAIVIALFILSASIACPILIRSLYYGQIQSLDLVERSGYSEETIREAFDEMMDYCTRGGENSGLEFGTGSLAWSQDGKAHFDDVAKLFSLDLNILKVSALALIIYVAFKFFAVKKDADEDGTIALGRGPFFWGPLGLLGLIIAIGIPAAVSFDRFFVAFHHVFFPGKENWIFDERYDEIIKILPEEVFRNFAILIGVLVIVLSVLSILLDFYIRRRTKQRGELE